MQQEVRKAGEVVKSAVSVRGMARASSTADEPVVPRLLAAHDLRRISASVMGACACVLSGWVRSLFFGKPGFASTQKSQSRYTLF